MEILIIFLPTKITDQIIFLNGIRYFRRLVIIECFTALTLFEK